MIDIHAEELVLLKEAAKLLPGRPHLATLYRWADEKAGGFKGIVLSTVYVGSKRFTSKQALQQFVEAVTAQRRGPTVPTPRAARQRQRDVADARQILAAKLRPRRTRA
jgi:hypothetical protein